jgi:hypothetical protein
MPLEIVGWHLRSMFDISNWETNIQTKENEEIFAKKFTANVLSI